MHIQNAPFPIESWKHNSCPFPSYFKTPGFYGSFSCKKCSTKSPDRYPTYMRATGFERRISRSRVDADTSILQLISGVEDLVNWHLSFCVYCVRVHVHHVQSIPVSNFLWCWVNFVDSTSYMHIYIYILSHIHVYTCTYMRLVNAFETLWYARALGGIAWARGDILTRWRLMNPNLYGQTHTGHNICDGKVHSQKHSGVDMKMACAPPFNHEHSCNLASAWSRGGYLIRHTNCTSWWDTHTVRPRDEIYFSWIMKNSGENMFYFEMKDLEQLW